MTTTINAVPGPASETASPAQRLRATTAAVRVSFEWLGARKTLRPDQKAQAAEPFGAEGQYLSAAKKLLNTAHPAFKAVSAIKGRIASLWKGTSLPYPDPGIRLIRQDQVETFNEQMIALRQELQEAVSKLNDHYAELRDTARQKLGSLYNPADYPPSLLGLFQVQWDFPSVEPPEYLMRLNPRLYEEQRRRMASRFEQAVALAEQAFIEEFGSLIEHLTERLTAGEDGRAKTFRNTAITRLHEFFQRFKSLSVNSNEELDRLVDTAQKALRGVGPQQLRDHDDLRQKVASQLSTVSATLEGLMVDRPRRRVLRRKTAGAE